MKNLSRLIPVFKLLEDKCAIKAGSAIRKTESLRLQAEQLKQYRSEYQNLDTRVPLLLDNARSFVRRLDASIEETDQRVTAGLQQVEEEKQNWATAKSRRKAVELLVKKSGKKLNTESDDLLTYWQVRCRNSVE